MKCTAPCFPPCQNEATTELLSLTNAHLGFNCDEHISRLRTQRVGNTVAEYNVRPLQPEPIKIPEAES